MTELPGRGEVLPTAGLPRLAVGAGAVWAVNPDGSISRIDLETGELVARIDTDAPAWTIAAGDEGVWYLSVGAESSVLSIDPRTNRTAQRIDLSVCAPLGSGDRGRLGLGDDARAGPVVADRARPQPGEPLDRRGRRGHVRRVRRGSRVDGQLHRRHRGALDPEDNAVTGKTPVDAPQALAAGSGGAWVSVAGRSTAAR